MDHETQCWVIVMYSWITELNHKTITRGQHNHTCQCINFEIIIKFWSNLIGADQLYRRSVFGCSVFISNQYLENSNKELAVTIECQNIVSWYGLNHLCTYLAKTIVQTVLIWRFCANGICMWCCILFPIHITIVPIIFRNWNRGPLIKWKAQYVLRLCSSLRANVWNM